MITQKWQKDAAQLCALFALVIFSLACGGLTVPEVTLPAVDVDAARATAEALGQGAINLGATAEAFATQNADFSVTAEAAASQAATFAVGSAERGRAIIEALQAAGFDADYLRAKVESAQPDENGNLNITITEAELNAVTVIRQELARQEGTVPPIENLQIRITGGNVVATGQVTEPLAGSMVVTFRPVVVDNGLRFEVVAATVGSVSLPETVLNGIEGTLNLALNNALLGLPLGVGVKDVVMVEGAMTIVAGRLP